MPRRKKKDVEIDDFRHDEKRPNNPEAGLAGYEAYAPERKAYAYDPHLDPQLVWAGKAEHVSFEVDTVPLHIHERVSSKAILRAARREDVQRELFAAEDLPLGDAVKFYQHDVDWANRLILGDSLVVMNSLLERELMAGKVQMIYIDPPYGVGYNSNFQPSLASRDVRDGDDASLTREAEQIKAYRDTWTLGIHSYLTYLRDRLLLARDLLADSGSVFVQINDENAHFVRIIMDEVFGKENFIAVISFLKTSGKGGERIDSVHDFLLWYVKDTGAAFYRKLYVERPKSSLDSAYPGLELGFDDWRRITSDEKTGKALVPGGKRFMTSSLFSASGGDTTSFDFTLRGDVYARTRPWYWKTNSEGMERLRKANRLVGVKKTLTYKRYADDYPFVVLTNFWDDTIVSTFASQKIFVVQTAEKVIERCILMTTDPGDLVLDPTCGSGTTAWCAEKWGRRWITCDTSRVALNLARQRLLTAKYDYYNLANPDQGPRGGFFYKTVPHVTLKSIAQNAKIDEIYDEHHRDVEPLRAELNNLLGQKWEEWEVPREAGEDWPAEARKVHEQWWAGRRRRQQAIDDEIGRAAPQETLYDQPEVERGVVRVAGPYTVEGIPVPAGAEVPEGALAPGERDDDLSRRGRGEGRVADPAGDHVATLVELLRRDGVTFPGGKKLAVPGIRAVKSGGFLHAEAEVAVNGDKQLVAFSFGPRYGPVTFHQVEEAIREAAAGGYGLLVFAGFGFEAEVTTFVESQPRPGLRLELANVCPDVLVGDLLKTTRGSQLFTVFGQPDVDVHPSHGKTWVAELRGVDTYDPTTGEVKSSRGRDVAAWFLDHDYDGRTFCVCQAFFPGGDNPWAKLGRALRGVIDEEAFARMRGTKSAPFRPGDHNRVAVKVIDFRGNEVIKVVELKEAK
jgi:adenine-specific DNA-methyltransferase